MVNTDLIDSLGIIGNIISFGLFISPAPTFYQIIKKGTVEDFSPNPYLAGVLNCLLWVLYGLPFVHPHGALIVAINGIGLMIELTYVCIFIKYATEKGRRYVMTMLAGVAVFNITAVLFTLLVENRFTTIGILCAAVNMMMYVMPLDNLPQVYETKSSQYMPKYLLLFNALNGGCQLVLALLRLDIFLVVTSGFGFLLGLIQIGVWWWYNNTQPMEEVDDGDWVDVSHSILKDSVKKTNSMVKNE
ncbi:bidirectional sugar transporter SWEET7b-like [Papaver somniferum]|uniref:bidirectional sugar transporter SWEET7b-like n=1 Tax=Papaver somniferum TaxID=3469 RepID=UPI000E6FE4A3|nr:bidirectional sugar transporter SWEET7b-like [Papaver somniferum]